MAVNISPFLYNARLPMHGGGGMTRVDNVGSPVTGIAQLVGQSLAGWQEGKDIKQKRKMAREEMDLRKSESEAKVATEKAHKAYIERESGMDPVTELHKIGSALTNLLGLTMPGPDGVAVSVIDTETGQARDPRVQTQLDLLTGRQQYLKNKMGVEDPAATQAPSAAKRLMDDAVSRAKTQGTSPVASALTPVVQTPAQLNAQNGNPQTAYIKQNLPASTPNPAMGQGFGSGVQAASQMLKAQNTPPTGNTRPIQAAPSTVKMRAPDGKVWEFDASEEREALQNGYVRIQ